MWEKLVFRHRIETRRYGFFTNRVIFDTRPADEMLIPQSEIGGLIAIMQKPPVGFLLLPDCLFTSGLLSNDVTRDREQQDEEHFHASNVSHPSCQKQHPLRELSKTRQVFEGVLGVAKSRCHTEGLRPFSGSMSANAWFQQLQSRASGEVNLLPFSIVLTKAQQFHFSCADPAGRIVRCL